MTTISKAHALCLVMLVVGCRAGSTSDDLCETCPEDHACGTDGRCRLLCNADVACGACGMCVQGLCYAVSNCDPDANDVTPPAAPESFAASSVEDTVALSWKLPGDPDFAEVMIARFEASGAFGEPATDVIYDVGEPLGAGVVVYAGSASAAQELDVPCGPQHYRLWARDWALNWSTSQSADLTVGEGLPAAPADVSGPGGLCAFTGGVSYSTADVPGAGGYLWQVPEGSVISSGQGTSAITVVFAEKSGQVTVRAVNYCGESPPATRSVAVDAGPATPGAIIGRAEVCVAPPTLGYAVAPVAGATSYAWSVPPGASITSGQGTAAVQVDWGEARGVLSVVAHSGCAASAASQLDVSAPAWTTYGDYQASAFGWLADLTVDAAGRIYVVDGGRARIARMDDIDGSGFRSFGRYAYPSTGAFGEFEYIFDVAVDSAGRIYVVDYDGYRLVRFDDMDGSNWTTLQFGSGGASGVVIDDDDRIYITFRGFGGHPGDPPALVRIDDITGAGAVGFGNGGSGVGQFNNAIGVALDEAGRIYIADQGNHRIVRIDDMEGTGWTTYGGAGVLTSPTDVFVDAQGGIYITEYGANRLTFIEDMSGTGVLHFGTSGSGDGQFDDLRGVTLDAEGRILLTDQTNQRLVRLDDMTGAGFTALTTAPSDDTTGYYEPSGVLHAGSGDVFVADSGNSRLVRMDDPGGAGWTTYGTPGTGDGQFLWPVALAEDQQGKLYIADYEADRVVRIDDVSGAGWIAYGGPGGDAFNMPTALALDADDKIYVLDSAKDRIVRVDDMSGAGLVTLAIGAGAGDGLAVDASGRIYFPYGNAVRRVDDMAGSNPVTLGSKGLGPNQFGYITGIAFDRLDRVYIADSSVDRVARVDDLAGTGWTTLGAGGDGELQFNFWAKPSMDEVGFLLVPDTYNHRLVRVCVP